MALAPEQMIWLTKYVICALPVMGLLSLLVRRDPISLCFGFVLLLLSPVLLSAVAALQVGSPEPYLVGVMAIAGILLLPAILISALNQMQSGREDL